MPSIRGLSRPRRLTLFIVIAVAVVVVIVGLAMASAAFAEAKKKHHVTVPTTTVAPESRLMNTSIVLLHVLFMY